MLSDKNWKKRISFIISHICAIFPNKISINNDEVPLRLVWNVNWAVSEMYTQFIAAWNWLSNRRFPISLIGHFDSKATLCNGTWKRRSFFVGKSLSVKKSWQTYANLSRRVFFVGRKFGRNSLITSNERLLVFFVYFFIRGNVWFKLLICGAETLLTHKRSSFICMIMHESTFVGKNYILARYKSVVYFRKTLLLLFVNNESYITGR